MRREMQRSGPPLHLWLRAPPSFWPDPEITVFRISHNICRMFKLLKQLSSFMQICGVTAG